MSVRAHKVIEIYYDNIESFNLWHDDVLVSELEDKGLLRQLNEDLSGLLEIPVDVLKEIVNKNREKIKRDVVEKLLEDIYEAEKRGDYSIVYYCY